MGKGVDAVTAAIMAQFDSPTLHVDEFDTEDRKLTITAEGKEFVIYVTWEFDDDFGKAPHVDLRRLGDILRKVGKVTIGQRGISAKP